MAMLKGLILAATRSEDDDLVYRLQGRSRYAMQLANRALVRYAAEALSACGVRDAAVVVSPGTMDDVKAAIGGGAFFDQGFRYLELPETATVAEALLAAHQELGGHPLVIHSGDAIVNGGLAAAVKQFERSPHDVLLLSEPSHCYPGLALAGVRGATRTHEPFRDPEHVAPAAILSAEVLRQLEDLDADTATVGGTVAALAESGVRIGGIPLDGCWIYAPDYSHLLEANRMILDELPHMPVEAELDGVKIEGRVAIHPEARLERTTIRGPAVIGGAATLSDTFIGPYTAIGAGARLEGAELEHSIVLEGAVLRNLGQRVEASVIGMEAEISRDFGMPTALRLQIGRRSSVTVA